MTGIALHLGPLHPLEHLLVYVLAFGPLLLLGFTVWLSRRRNSGDSGPAARLGSAHERSDPDRSTPDR